MILINNENQKVKVSQQTYDELKREFKNGVWAMIIKLQGETHIINLLQNFK